jgi:hypothetical protein
VDKRYIAKVRKERGDVLGTAFWAEYEKLIKDARKGASRRCETDIEARLFQGEVKAYDKVLRFPLKIIEILEGKRT